MVRRNLRSAPIVTVLLCLATGTIAWFASTIYHDNYDVMMNDPTTSGQMTSGGGTTPNLRGDDDDDPSDWRKKKSNKQEEHQQDQQEQLYPNVTPKQEDQNQAQQEQLKHPNVLFLMCDDLNDYIETMGGHPQAITPNIRRLMETSVTFTQAHANIPLCKPSRCSFLSGLYPHTSGFLSPDTQPSPIQVFKHQRTLIEHFNKHGYRTMGTGKIDDGFQDRRHWKRVGERTGDYGPFVYNKTAVSEVERTINGSLAVTEEDRRLVQNVAHPFVPAPFRNLGAIRGSFGPLVQHPNKDMSWRTGDYRQGFREIEFQNATHRDQTTDEKSAEWAIRQLQLMENASSTTENEEKPFFLGVGLVRPHHPMVVSQKYFDMYPLETLELPPSFLEHDVNDTMRQTLEKIGLGPRMYHDLIESYNFNRKDALLRYIRAYLASVTAADELLGKVLDALDASSSRIKDNTIVVFTSDHGYQVGQKDYLGKNLLWQATTRVPLVVRVPGVTTTTTAISKESKQAAASKDETSLRTCNHPVSLVDLYPTLIDLCGLSKDNSKDDQSLALDGHSLRPFLETSAEDNKWTGPDFALSAISQEFNPDDEIGISLATRYDNWRYIRYKNGKEELYNTKKDPYEWTNLAMLDGNNTAASSKDGEEEDIDALLTKFRTNLFQFVNKRHQVAASTQVR